MLNHNGHQSQYSFGSDFFVNFRELNQAVRAVVNQMPEDNTKTRLLGMVEASSSVFTELTALSRLGSDSTLRYFAADCRHAYPENLNVLRTTAVVNAARSCNSTYPDLAFSCLDKAVAKYPELEMELRRDRGEATLAYWEYTTDARIDNEGSRIAYGENAAKDFLCVAKLSGDIADPMYKASFGYSLARKFEDAIQCLNESGTIDTRHGLIKYAIAENYIALGKQNLALPNYLESAREMHKHLLDTTPSEENVRILIKCYASALEIDRNYKPALAGYDAATELYISVTKPIPDYEV